MLITDGPFTEGKEHVGGFVVIKVADLDAALEWAGRAARALTVGEYRRSGGEVRPFQGEPGH